MRYTELQPTNVVKIAQKLLTMKKEAFEKEHQEEVTSQLVDLGELLFDYLWPKRQERFDSRCADEILEQYLHQLMQRTYRLLSLLTPAKRTQLHAALVKTTKLPLKLTSEKLKGDKKLKSGAKMPRVQSYHTQPLKRQRRTKPNARIQAAQALEKPLKPKKTPGS